MALPINVDGVELSQYFGVTNVVRNIGSNRTNNFIKVGRADGSKLTSVTLDENYIDIEFNILYDLNKKRRELAGILFKKEPFKLIIGDEPNIYYNALVDGQPSLSEMNFLGKGQIRFVIPDGTGYSLELKEFTTTSSKFTVQNDGNYHSYPILEATMPADNGVVAFLNDRGNILQFGNPDEADTEAYSESDRVIWDTVMYAPAEESRGWKLNEYQFSEKWGGWATLNANGQRRFGDDSGYGYVECSNYGTGAQGFKGITYGRKVSPDSQGHIGSKDFESRHGIWFETTNIKQTGIFLCELRDKDGNQVCSVAFYKTNSTNNNAYIRVNTRGNIKKDVLFQPTAWNFYSKKGREFSIVKTGKTIRFHIGGIANGGFIHSVTLDELQDVEVTDVVYYIGVPVASTASPLSFMRLTHSTFRKDNVDKLRDIKNLYGESDVLRVDCGTGVATVNGIEMKGLGSLGNDWDEFFLEPGLNEIECIASSWAQQPNYKLYNREVYL